MFSFVVNISVTFLAEDKPEINIIQMVSVMGRAIIIEFPHGYYGSIDNLKNEFFFLL